MCIYLYLVFAYFSLLFFNVEWNAQLSLDPRFDRYICHFEYQLSCRCALAAFGPIQSHHLGYLLKACVPSRFSMLARFCLPSKRF